MEDLREVCQADAPDTAILTSAGALIESLQAIGAKKVSIITPYMKSLTRLVTGYIENENIGVVDAISLEVPNNLAVRALDPMALIDIVKRLSVANVDAVVLSACVQMPSLHALQPVRDSLDVPVLSTAAATVFRILQTLDINATVPNAGDLLSGNYA